MLKRKLMVPLVVALGFAAAPAMSAMVELPGRREQHGSRATSSRSAWAMCLSPRRTRAGGSEGE